MQDVISGIVDTIIDADTFILNVTGTRYGNQNKYVKWERIRIASFEADEADIVVGVRDKIKLERAILGKEVICTVQTRDTFGRIVADVRLV